jgi:hypothetical protein
MSLGRASYSRSVFWAEKRVKRVADPFKQEEAVFFNVMAESLFVRSAELTPTFFLYDDIATPAGPIVR